MPLVLKGDESIGPGNMREDSEVVKESTYYHYQDDTEHISAHDHGSLFDHSRRPPPPLQEQELLTMSRSGKGWELLWLIIEKRTASHRSIGLMTDAENDFNKRDVVESKGLLNSMTAEFEDDVKALFDQHDIAQANLVDSSIDNTALRDIRLDDIHEHTRTILPGSVRLIFQEICRLRTYTIKSQKTIC